MFCPKCGQKNPETGKFCRSCGTDLGNVSSALTGKPLAPIVNKKGKQVTWEGAITKFATGLAFLAIALYLGFSNMAGGRVWWFWMLIPAFTMIGSGVAQYVQLKKQEKGLGGYQAADQPHVIANSAAGELPPKQTEYVSPESHYKTGDLVPPSVTDNTTRHLELDSEGRTMTLPKK